MRGLSRERGAAPLQNYGANYLHLAFPGEMRELPESVSREIRGRETRETTTTDDDG